MNCVLIKTTQKSICDVLWYFKQIDSWKVDDSTIIGLILVWINTYCDGHFVLESASCNSIGFQLCIIYISRKEFAVPFAKFWVDIIYIAINHKRRANSYWRHDSIIIKKNVTREVNTQHIKTSM